MQKPRTPKLERKCCRNGKICARLRDRWDLTKINGVTKKTINKIVHHLITSIPMDIIVWFTEPGVHNKSIPTGMFTFRKIVTEWVNARFQGFQRVSAKRRVPFRFVRRPPSPDIPLLLYPASLFSRSRSRSTAAFGAEKSSHFSTDLINLSAAGFVHVSLFFTSTNLSHFSVLATNIR